MFTAVLASANAQVVITSFDMPNANDEVRVSVVGTSDYSSVTIPTATGTAQTWDYSSLSVSTQQFERFDAPEDFVSPYNYLFNPFNTSYGRDNYEFSTIPLPGATISAAYDFFKEDLTKFKQIGAGYVINGLPLPFLYSDEEVIYEFPLAYNNTNTDNYKYGLPIPSIGYYGQSGTRSNVVDGWGTLITPYGSFQTIRVKSTVEATDTIYNSSLMLGANISRPTKHEYKWLTNGKKIPLLKIETTVISGNEAVTAVRYIDSLRNGVPQVGIEELAVNSLNTVLFPNPCTDEFTVAYQLSAANNVKITLTNMVGKVVVVESKGLENAGIHKKTIPTAGLDAGIYFVNIETDTYKEIRKVVVTK